MWALTIEILCTLLAVICAGVCLRLASRSARMQKRMRDVESEMSELNLSFETLLESHKRLRSRAGMRELRAREAPVAVESKADVRRRLFGGATGPAFAKAQIDASRSIRSAEER